MTLNRSAKSKSRRRRYDALVVFRRRGSPEPSGSHGRARQQHSQRQHHRFQEGQGELPGPAVPTDVRRRQADHRGRWHQPQGDRPGHVDRVDRHDPYAGFAADDRRYDRPCDSGQRILRSGQGRHDPVYEGRRVRTRRRRPPRQPGQRLPRSGLERADDQRRRDTEYLRRPRRPRHPGRLEGSGAGDRAGEPGLQPGQAASWKFPKAQRRRRSDRAPGASRRSCTTPSASSTSCASNLPASLASRTSGRPPS